MNLSLAKHVFLVNAPLLDAVSQAVSIHPPFSNPPTKAKQESNIKKALESLSLIDCLLLSSVPVDELDAKRFICLLFLSMQA